jgi:hypothetical protein
MGQSRRAGSARLAVDSRDEMEPEGSGPSHPVGPEEGRAGKSRRAGVASVRVGMSRWLGGWMARIVAGACMGPIRRGDPGRPVERHVAADRCGPGLTRRAGTSTTREGLVRLVAVDGTASALASRSGLVRSGPSRGQGAIRHGWVRRMGARRHGALVGSAGRVGRVSWRLGPSRRGEVMMDRSWIVAPSRGRMMLATVFELHCRRGAVRAGETRRAGESADRVEQSR